MKTAISLPDQVFEEAERLAEKMGVSRSALYTAALESYLLQRNEDAITRQLNRAYAESNDSESESLDKLVQHSVPLYDKW